MPAASMIKLPLAGAVYQQVASGQWRLTDTITGILRSTYELDCGVSFDPPLTSTGTFILNGDILTTVDGTTLTTHLAPLDISLN